MFTGESYIGDTAKAPIFNLSFFRQFCNGLVDQGFFNSDGPRDVPVLRLAYCPQIFQDGFSQIVTHLTFTPTRALTRQGGGESGALSHQGTGPQGELPFELGCCSECFPRRSKVINMLLGKRDLR